MPFSDPLDPSIAVPGQYYIDYSTDNTGNPGDPDFGVYYCALPEHLQFEDAISGGGTCSWEWTLSALDMENNPIVSHNFIGPWRSYYRLRCGNDIILAGPVTGVNSKFNDQFMSVAGGTWESYMDRYQYPFDPRTTPPPDGHVNDFQFGFTLIGNESVPSGGATPAGLVYQAQNRDVAIIAQDLLVTTMGQPNRLFFDVSAYGTPVGITTNYQLTLGDDSTMMSILNNLAGIREGFDWWIGTVSRNFFVGSPYRYGSNLAPFIYYTFLKDTPGLLDIEFDNDGVQATHVLGRGAGLASQTQLGSAFGSRDNQLIYHRLDASYDFGDVRNSNQLDDLTRKRLALSTKPAHRVTVSVDPAQIPNYWPTFRKGRAVYVAIDLGWHRVDAAFQIESYSCSESGSETGTMQVDLTLKQIYPITVTDSEFFPDL